MPKSRLSKKEREEKAVAVEHKHKAWLEALTSEKAFYGINPTPKTHNSDSEVAGSNLLYDNQEGNLGIRWWEKLLH